MFDLRDGESLYDTILREHPKIEKDFESLTIWIDRDSGQYLIGEGSPAANRLIERLGIDDGVNFYSRRIGKLARLPIR